jgi:hypothetical protein
MSLFDLILGKANEVISGLANAADSFPRTNNFDGLGDAQADGQWRLTRTKRSRIRIL